MIAGDERRLPSTRYFGWLLLGSTHGRFLMVPKQNTDGGHDDDDGDDGDDDDDEDDDDDDDDEEEEERGRRSMATV